MNKPVFLPLEKVQIQMMAAGIGQALPLHSCAPHWLTTSLSYTFLAFESEIPHYVLWALKKKHANVIWKQKETIAWIKDLNWVKVDFPMAGP